MVHGAVPQPQPVHGEIVGRISPGSGRRPPTAVHTLPPHLPTPKQAPHSHLGGRLSQELGGITPGSRVISGPFPLRPSVEMHSPFGTGPCLGPRASPCAYLTTALGPLLVPGLLLSPAGLRAWLQGNRRQLLPILLAPQPWHQLLGPKRFLLPKIQQSGPVNYTEYPYPTLLWNLPGERAT